jgi:prefoldin subunit 5
VSSSAGAKATSHDASVASADNAEPAAEAQQDYLKAREHDLGEAVKKVQKKIKEMQAAATQLEKELAQVRAERKG